MKLKNFIDFLSGIFKDKMYLYSQVIFYGRALKSFLQAFTTFCQLCQIFTIFYHLEQTFANHLSKIKFLLVCNNFALTNLSK